MLVRDQPNTDLAQETDGKREIVHETTHNPED